MGRLNSFFQNLRDRRAAHLDQKMVDGSLAPADATTSGRSMRGRHAPAVTADPFAYEASHRRSAWMLRLSAGMNIGLMACLVVSFNVIAGMVPLKEKVPFWIIPADEDEIRFQIKPVIEDVNAFDVELEGKARRYVKARLEIDGVTQEERQREVSRMTERGEWIDFRNEWIDSGKISDAIAGGLDREIRIESANKVASLTGDYKFAIDFIRIDRRNGKPVGEPTKLRAYLSMVTSEQTVSLEQKYINPYGITVTDMILRARGSS
ncbi:type IV secretion system protein [Thalassospira sp. GB04J01]|uniref:type IV secretion system protein n=1 Tax=Thalassospira sp. GB04J01 TaxID=1485225 RepID=UPI000C9A1B75|nr:type IV secretion system protein [Thalassospira sp. GB04J01]|tara:strand:- start:22695 stop:23486 length:792 start_codon:yes stop_codon:yes gene_type:complete